MPHDTKNKNDAQQNPSDAKGNPYHSLKEMPPGKRETLFRKPEDASREGREIRYPEGYPEKYVRKDTLKDGTKVIIRPALPKDAPDMVPFVDKLSDESLHKYYHRDDPRKERNIAKGHFGQLREHCLTNDHPTDYTQNMVIVVRTEQNELISVGQLVQNPNKKNEPAVSLFVADQFQNKGLGSKLLGLSKEFAHDQGFTLNVETTNPKVVDMCLKQGGDIKVTDVEDLKYDPNKPKKLVFDLDTEQGHKQESSKLLTPQSIALGTGAWAATIERIRQLRRSRLDSKL